MILIMMLSGIPNVQHSETVNKLRLDLLVLPRQLHMDMRPDDGNRVFGAVLIRWV